MINIKCNQKLGCAILASILVALPVFSARAEGTRCLVVHVPQASPVAFKQAVNIMNNIPKQLGADNVRIELVAQGSGLKLLTKGSPEAARIKSVIVQGKETLGGGVQFSACGTTIAGIKRRTGKEPELLKGIKVVPGGVARVMELQEQGCSYIRI
ncbi:MAG: DsrE family protein [Gammaproteobacteria bacterium]